MYHLMVRGINRQNIFEEPEDYEKCLFFLTQCKSVSGLELYGYCLMPNHIHLLLKEGTQPLERAMKWFAGKYAVWFNLKYSRTGHLFGDRFKSEPVEDESYFMTVLRYIHFNPVKAGLVKTPGEYLYSSYANYYGSAGIVDTAKAFSFAPWDIFEEFHAAGCPDVCLDLPASVMPRLTEEQATAVMRRVTACGSSAEFQALSRETKNALIAKMKAQRMSIRQISRLTGETYYMIQKAQ